MLAMKFENDRFGPFQASMIGPFVEIVTYFYPSTMFAKSWTAWKVPKYGVFSGPYFPALVLNTER